MKEQIRWGIMGTGWIAERFSTALNALKEEGAVLYAVGSRTQETADTFSERFGFEKAYGSYEDLVSDPAVDVVYVATPHRFHFENAMLCLEHGKAVLCEKAFTVNAAEARTIAQKAAEKQVFVMEAFWTRFQPLNRRLHRLVCEDGLIGDIRMMQIDFDKIEDWPDTHRIYNPQVAGGTILDLGIYTMSYAAYFLGAEPEHIHGECTIGKGGVDDQCAMLLKYPGGALCLQTAALQTEGRREALILGTKGQICVPQFSKATRCTWTDYASGTVTDIDEGDFLCNGYEYEAMEVMNCLRDGRLQSSIMPLDETVRLMELLDEWRAQCHFRYPFED